MQGQAAENSVHAQLVGHFGLRENPFGVTPDPRFLFLSETHGEALASLINGIDCEFGFQLLLAQPGMGKTTLLFNFLERFRTTAYTAFLFQPLFEPRDLLQAVLSELGKGSQQTSTGKLSEELIYVLGRAAQERKRVIVVVDEAQNLDFPVLEALRQLSNFETAQNKLMQIVLAGQPQLAKKLGSPEQEQLLQRISSIGRLSPLALNETQTYIHHRLKTAGYRGGDLFTQGATFRVWEYSKGVPRNINTLCFSAMLVAFAEHARSIDERILREASRDLDLQSALADLYQRQPLATVPGGKDKQRVIWETQPVEADIDVSDVILQEAEATPARPVDGGTAGIVANVPAAPAAALAPIPQTLEEQKMLLLARAIPSAQTPFTAAFQAPAGSSRTAQPEPSTPVKGGNAAAGHHASRRGKNSSSTTIVDNSGALPELRPGSNSVLTPARPVRAGNGSFSPAPAVRRGQPAAGRRSGEGRAWLKILYFGTATAILAFMLLEKPWQRPAQVEAPESVPEQGNSASESGTSAPGGGKDSLNRSPKNGSADLRSPRNAGSPDSDQVRARKFPPGPSAGSSPSQPSLNRIFFDQDSAVIGWQYRATLQQIADALAENPDSNAILEGHTDSSGEEAYNLDLSGRRAGAVRDALVNGLHVSGARLATISAGSAAPIQPNSTAAGRAYNRRVEVRLALPNLP
jgi:general secretion pathway protein A